MNAGPPSPLPESKGRSLLAILLALGLFLGACAVLLLLSGGFFGLVLIIGGGVFAMAALHYVTWGWWLSKKIREEVEAEDEES